MSIEATYAGIPLVFPTRELLEFSRTRSLFDPEDYLRDPGFRHLHGFESYNQNPMSHISKMDIGTLYWPTGATRFGCGFFLVSSEHLEKLPGFDVGGKADELDQMGGIRNMVNGTLPNRAPGCKPHFLEMQTSADYGQKLAVKMWMLPPRPLFQARDGGMQPDTEVVAKFPFPHRNALWVLPLVDDRYWWWWHTTGIFKQETCSTWRSLFYEVFSRIGYSPEEVSIKANAFLEDHLFPHELLRKQEHSFRVPVLLDLMCQSTNGRLVLDFDGTVRVSEAFEDFQAFVRHDNSVKAGGRGCLASLDLKQAREQPDFPDGSDLLSDITTYNRLLGSVRDTGGVIPSLLNFFISGQPHSVLTTADDMPMVEEETQSPTMDQRFTRNGVEGRLRYFSREDGGKFAPTRAQDVPQKWDGSGKVADPFGNGDFALDTKNNLLYGPKEFVGWGVGRYGHSVLGKNFRVHASSYKSRDKVCPTLMRRPVGTPEKTFSDNQLQAFLRKFTRDWVYRQLADMDVVSAGILPVNLNGNMDHVLFHLNPDTATKVVRAPYNDMAEDIFIESYLGDEGACSADTHPCGQCKGVQGDSVTTQLYGFGTADMFLPYSPVQAKNTTVPGTATPVDYPHWHKPPYVLKFCLGGGIGNVALDYHFQHTMNVSVYWNGEKVAARTVYGSKSFSCQSASQAWGRLTFFKTAKTPSYAIVVVDASSDFTSQQDAGKVQPHNWYMNMRCVDSIPYPAPRAIACDSKLNEVGGVFTLGMFTSIPVNIPGSSNGIVPNTPICVAESTDSQVLVNGANCTAPGKLLLAFRDPPESCAWLRDVSIPLQQSNIEGGWVGITDQFGPAQDIVQARLSIVGNSSFKLVLKDIVNTARAEVQCNNITSMQCVPFTLTVPGVDLTPFTCVPGNPNPLQIIITEA